MSAEHIHHPPDHAPPPQVAPVSDLQTAYMASVIAAVVVAGIYFGRPILVPLALAVILAFALGPVVSGLRRLRLGHVPSVILAVLFAVLMIGAFGAFIGTQFARLAADLPHYQTNLSQKIQSVRDSANGDGVVHRAAAMFDKLSDQILGPENSTPAANGAPEQKPIPVVIRQPQSAPLRVAKDVVGPLLDPLATVTIVMVFVIFMLLQKEDLRDRFIRLAGSRDLQRTTVALDEAASRLSRYLLLQTTVNAWFGLLVFFGLWAIGVPNPGLWGLMAGMFRVVPYVGVPIAAAVPILLSVAADPGWSMVFWTLGLFVVMEGITGQAIEPFLYGRNIGLSAVAIVVAAAFWTWLWGPVGLLLSTPLTMCLVVLGRHVDALKFLDVMLGDRPPLAMEESFYLRILAGNPDEAAGEAESFLRENSLIEYFDQVAIRALTLAQKDADRGALDEKRRLRIKETIRELIANLTEHEQTQSGPSLNDPEGPHFSSGVHPLWDGGTVLCVAGRGHIDEIAAMLLAHVLTKEGIAARVISSEEVSPANIHLVEPAGVRAVCMSYLDPGNYKNARYLVRRLKRQIPDAVSIGGFWGLSGDTAYLDALEATGCDAVATSLTEAISHIQAAASGKFVPASAQKKDAASA
jgi:predicted PurR-regulated permease PerM